MPIKVIYKDLSALMPATNILVCPLTTRPQANMMIAIQTLGRMSLSTMLLGTSKNLLSISKVSTGSLLHTLPVADKEHRNGDVVLHALQVQVLFLNSEEAG